MPVRNAPKFDLAEGNYKTVKKIVPVELFLAAGIVDGEGKQENRILLRAKGDDQFYFLFPKGTEAAMKPAAGWLQELMTRESAGKAEIPEDGMSVPTGDPLED